MATPIPENRCSFTLGEIASITGGALAGADAATRVTGIYTDSRTVPAGALFVALVGEAHDGHAHVAGSLARGASAALVQRGRAADIQGPRIEVADTLIALGELARAHADRERAKRRVPSVAVTGSAGKTTTKEILAGILRGLYGSVLATAGNLNNRVGVPMTLFTLGGEHAAMVIETGTSLRGEIAALGHIVQPDVGIVLNADSAHTAGIGTVEDVADEKGALFAAATRAAVGNADDPVSLARIERANVPRLTFGVHPEADARLVSRAPQPDGRVRVTVALSSKLTAPGTDGTLVADLTLLGTAAALDACAAVAAVAALRDGGLTRADLDTIAASLASVQTAPGRLRPMELNGSVVLDDTYNANPRSVRASLAAARELADGIGGRLLVVLGDMRELGELSRELHESVGHEVARVRASTFVAVGDEMAHAARAAAGVRAGAPVVVELQHVEDAHVVVQSVIRPRDVVLVKGSRGMKMERVVSALLAPGTDGGRGDGGAR